MSFSKKKLAFLAISISCLIGKGQAAPMTGMEDDPGVFLKSKESPPPSFQSGKPAITPPETTAQVMRKKAEAIDQAGFNIQAQAIIKPTKGNTVTGTVKFTPVISMNGAEAVLLGIRVIADLEGLTPNEKHGFHVHEFGDCSADDASSAGGHFNPSGFLHGSPDSTTRHVGDLGNVQADAQGKAHYERVDKVIAFSGSNSIIGKSIVVHAKEDDFTTQPTGNAGARIGCGVIESIKPPTGK